MLKGAFKSIVHDHNFERKGDVTIMTDRFHYESPGWILGTIANKLVLNRYLTKLLITRNAVIKREAEALANTSIA